MNYFLVDFENVHSEGMNGIKQLDDNDVVIIFYSKNANSISFDMLKAVLVSNAKFILQEASVGNKNALDFQLSTYLGFLMRDTLLSDEKNLNRYFIVSKDKGYDYVTSFLEELLKGFKINPVKCISTIKEGLSSRVVRKNNIIHKSKLELPKSKPSALTKESMGEVEFAVRRSDLEDRPATIVKAQRERHDMEMKAEVNRFSESSSKLFVLDRIQGRIPDTGELLLLKDEIYRNIDG